MSFSMLISNTLRCYYSSSPFLLLSFPAALMSYYILLLSLFFLFLFFPYLISSRTLFQPPLKVPFLFPWSLYSHNINICIRLYMQNMQYRRKMYSICPSDSKIFWLWQFIVPSFFWKCPDFILLWLNKTLLDKCITFSLSIYMFVTFCASLIHTYYDIRTINSMYKYLWAKTSNLLSGYSIGIAGYLSENAPYWFS